MLAHLPDDPGATDLCNGGDDEKEQGPDDSQGRYGPVRVDKVTGTGAPRSRSVLGLSSAPNEDCGADTGQDGRNGEPAECERGDRCAGNQRSEEAEHRDGAARSARSSTDPDDPEARRGLRGTVGHVDAPRNAATTGHRPGDVDPLGSERSLT